MASQNQGPNMETFEAYFRRADLDKDGRISGAEAVAFFQGANLPKHILAQIWMHADQKQIGFLERAEFFNALRLVTVAQSGRELTPDIVKAALAGALAAKIPAPQITLVNPHQNVAFRGSQMPPNVGMSQHLSRPPMATAANVSLPIQGAFQGLGQGFPATGTSGATLNVPNRGVVPAVVHQSGSTSLPPSKPPQPFLPTSSTGQNQQVSVSSSFHTGDYDSNRSVVSGNGFASDPIFGGDVFTATPSQKKQDSFTHTPASTTIVPVASASQQSITHGQANLLQNRTISPSSQPQPQPQPQLAISLAKQSQPDAIHSSLALSGSGVSVGAEVSGQSQLPWPKVSQSNIQKYIPLFVNVDTDRDGKITGEQARMLFLSWKLPIEILKRIWDLSDQDKDSMLSLKEFCIALYMMERYREGRPLPAVLPSNIGFDEILFPFTGQSFNSYGRPSWQSVPVLVQRVAGGQHPVASAAGLLPPRQGRNPPLPKSDVIKETTQKKSMMPILESHLVNQLSEEEQNALKSKFEEATASDKKVSELEKEILDSKEKIEFFRTKMQELVLYKSRCDNRLNEITEKVSADKREVEMLAKKYEEKYIQGGHVASKLTMDEATFRDLQGKKMDLYNAIVKMEGNVDGSLQDYADRIQRDLEELVKSLNERCKQYGLRAKPTTLLELPFGWQPGIQEDAAVWDEIWDKFEDDGFSVLKEMTIEVETVISKISSPRSVVTGETAADKSVKDIHPNDGNKVNKPSSEGVVHEKGKINAEREDELVKTPTAEASGKSNMDSPSEEIHAQFDSAFDADVSPHSKENLSDYGGNESARTSDKYNDEHFWGETFSDTNDDVDSVWGFNAVSSKESDYDKNQNSLFGTNDFGLNPIRTGSPRGDNLFQKRDRGPFSIANSIPSSPFFNSGSPANYSIGTDEPSFDTSSRFDSFSIHDSGLFPPRESLARYDSIRSTQDFNLGRESLARFDSIRSTTQDFNPVRETFTGFDSIRSTSQDFNRNQGFPSFDDNDPFGSSGPFKALERQTPRRDTDGWSAF